MWKEAPAPTYGDSILGAKAADVSSRWAGSLWCTGRKLLRGQGQGQEQRLKAVVGLLYVWGCQWQRWLVHKQHQYMCMKRNK